MFKEGANSMRKNIGFRETEIENLEFSLSEVLNFIENHKIPDLIMNRIEDLPDDIEAEISFIKLEIGRYKNLLIMLEGGKGKRIEIKFYDDNERLEAITYAYNNGEIMVIVEDGEHKRIEEYNIAQIEYVKMLE